jgi:predicted kinase
MSKDLFIIRGAIAVGKTTTIHALRERLQPASTIELDLIKRQVDTLESSNWRREVSVRVATTLLGELMSASRTIIADVHSNMSEQRQQYLNLAIQHGYNVGSFHLVSPFQTTMERANARYIPGIHYEVDAEMVHNYYHSAVFYEGETVIDSSLLSTSAIVDTILAEGTSRQTWACREEVVQH